MLFEDKNMTDLEFKLYNEWYTYMYPEIKVNNVVYLRTLPQTAYERMCRSRKEENCVQKITFKWYINFMITGLPSIMKVTIFAI